MRSTIAEREHKPAEDAANKLLADETKLEREVHQGREWNLEKEEKYQREILPLREKREEAFLKEEALLKEILETKDLRDTSTVEAAQNRLTFL